MATSFGLETCFSFALQFDGGAELGVMELERVFYVLQVSPYKCLNNSLLFSVHSLVPQAFDWHFTHVTVF